MVRTRGGKQERVLQDPLQVVVELDSYPGTGYNILQLGSNLQSVLEHPKQGFVSLYPGDEDGDRNDSFFL